MTTPLPQRELAGACGREVIGGVDTHGATHHAAAIDAATGRLLGDREFPATTAGYAALLAWLQSAGQVTAVGVEGTGSYGAGLFRHLAAAGVTVIEVARPSRQARRFQGKSDPIDAIAAARAVLARTATTVPKPRDGKVEAIRMIRATRRSAVRARRAAIGQIHGLLAGAPEPLRDKLRGYRRAALATRCAGLRPAPAAARDGDPAAVAALMLRRLARRIAALDAEITDADTQLATLIQATAPSLLAIFGVGTEAAGQLLTTAGENPHRLHSEAALARLCGTAPIPASSGTTTRHRLHRGGDRQANSAIHLIVINRLRWHPPTRAYLARRTTEGKTKKEIIRCLKRAIIRELYTALKTDLPHLPHPPLDSA
jgi:transposase